MKLSDIKPFAYSFGGDISGQMADVGRTVGSKTIGLNIQTMAPGCFSSRRHRHLFQEELLIVTSGEGTLHHGDQRIPMSVGDCVCYLPEDTEAHCFENTGTSDLVVWKSLIQGVAFVEGLGADVPLDVGTPSEWTEDRRKR